MHCTVRFHEMAVDDVRRYRRQLATNEMGYDCSALVNEQIMELKRLLARTGGRLENARMIRPGNRKGYDGAFEFEYVSNKVWIEFTRERLGRDQILVSVLRWRLQPYSDE
jgi:hypothetical protein